MASETPKKLSSSAAKSLCIQLVKEWANCDMPVDDIIWKNENGHGTCSDHDTFICQLYEMRIPSMIVIPKPIREQIEEHIGSILDQVKEWIWFHHSKHFFHDNPPSPPLNEYLLELVWNDENRRIDYAASARNMLTNENLTTMDKFRFACTYCFVEVVTSFRDLAEISSNWNFTDEPLLVYWSKYLKNELDTISLPENVLSVDVLMLERALQDYGLWSPVEYFFSQADAQNRSRLLNEFINENGAEHLDKLLDKLYVDDDWVSACRDSIDIILKDCAKVGRFERIRRVWDRCRNAIHWTNLSRVVEQLVPLSMTNSRNFNALTPILIEIWSSCAADQRQSAIEDELLARLGEKCANLIDRDAEFDLCACRECDEPMEFIRTLLTSGDRERTEVFLRDNLHWLVVWAPSTSAVRELLQEFLPRSRDVQNLVREVKDTSRLCFSCSRLIRFGEFDHFNEIVSFFLSGTGELDAITEDVVNEYKLALVDNGDVFFALRANFYSGDWRAVSRFVDATFRSSSVRPRTLMSILIDDSIQIEMFPRIDYLRRKLSRGEINDVVEFGSAYFARSSRYASFKNRCMVELFWCIFVDSDGIVFNREHVENFFAWCSAGYREWLEERLSAQPELLPRAFLAQLKGCVDESAFEASDSMEQFLQWRFPVESEKRQFKRDMIRSYSEYEQIADLLQQRKYRQRVLNWFFDEDADFVQCFVIFSAAAKAAKDRDPDEDSRDEGGSSCCTGYLLERFVVNFLRFCFYISRVAN